MLDYLIYRRVLVLLVVAVGLGVYVAGGIYVQSVDNNQPEIRIAQLSRLARAGDNDAQFQLGVMYHNGEGVKKSDYEAVKWYESAALRGLSKAQVMLGIAYFQGEGISKDRTQAARWFRRAAEQGSADGSLLLAWMYHNGTGLPKNRTQAAQWFRRAAEQGSADGAFQIGWMYHNGNGLPKDLVRADMWFIIARKCRNYFYSAVLSEYFTEFFIPSQEVEYARTLARSYTIRCNSK